MNPNLVSRAIPAMRLLDPERAHRLSLWALRHGLVGAARDSEDPILRVETLGLRFANPIGLAAGFDKDAAAVPPLMRLGFGFIEAGTVTPLPQPGNPRPRLFRLTEDRAVINRMGFNNAGIATYAARIAAVPRGNVPLGANLGINKGSITPEQDYPALVAAVAGRADYVVINVSSPNTPGLRRLETRDALSGLLASIARVVPVRPKLLVKLSPELTDAGLGEVFDVASAAGADGLIVCNTTLARPAGLLSRHAGQAGGLSGAPLAARALEMLRVAARLNQQLPAGKRLVLIASGGIATGQDVMIRLRAGAHLVQLYSEFARVGPPLIPRMKAALAIALREAGFTNVMQAIGADL